MGIDHGRLHILIPEIFLDIALTPGSNRFTIQNDLTMFRQAGSLRSLFKTAPSGESNTGYITRCDEEMKSDTPDKARRSLYRHAMTSMISGWVTCATFVAMFGGAFTLWRMTRQYWGPSRIRPFQRDCLAALANAPDMMKRFESFCGHFDIAAATAQELTQWLMFFSLLVAFLAACQARFARRVLKHMKETENHNHTSEGIRQPADGSSEPSM